MTSHYFKYLNKIILISLGGILLFTLCLCNNQNQKEHSLIYNDIVILKGDSFSYFYKNCKIEYDTNSKHLLRTNGTKYVFHYYNMPANLTILNGSHEIIKNEILLVFDSCSFNNKTKYVDSLNLGAYICSSLENNQKCWEKINTVKMTLNKLNDSIFHLFAVIRDTYCPVIDDTFRLYKSNFKKNINFINQYDEYNQRQGQWTIDRKYFKLNGIYVNDQLSGTISEYWPKQNSPFYESLFLDKIIIMDKGEIKYESDFDETGKQTNIINNK